jgi:hypothetical protein
MKLIIIILLFVFLYPGCSKLNRERRLNEMEKGSSGKVWSINSTNDWMKNKGLLNVESIEYDKKQQVFYASNGLNYKPGIDGYISKISMDGSPLALEWVAGLNRPTGMAIFDSILYVADVNVLVLININNGKIIERVSEPIANSGLNDVAITKNGEVFVSASFVHAILKLNSGKLEIWLRDEEKLKWANGLVAEEDRIIVGGLDLSSISLDSKHLTKIELNTSVQDFDGMVSDGFGGYFLTTVESSSLFYFDGKTCIYKLKEESAYFGDLAFNPDGNKLYVPRGNKTTAEYFITEMKMNSQSLKEYDCD